MRAFHPIWTIAAVALVCCGCGRQAYELAPVSGTVKLDGKPLAGGVVNFQPIGGEVVNPGPGSSGITDAQGRYVLQIQATERRPGAVVGEHIVRIYSRNPEAPRVDDTDIPGQSEPERVPMKYNYNSKLTYSVGAEGADQANFDLDSNER